MVVTSAPTLAACAGFLPVPGGGESLNRTFYSMQEDLLIRLNGVRPGMNEDEVFTALGHSKSDMLRLECDQIMTAMYGSTSIEFYDGAPGHEDRSTFLQSLYGYRLTIKS